MRKAPSTVLRLGMAAAFAGVLFMNSESRIHAQPARAHSDSATHAGLKTLRLDYFVGSNGKLATTLDPAIVTSAGAADEIALTDSLLVYIGADDKVHNGLASKVTVSSNHKVYTFFIRKNARYADGHYVKASDVIFAIKVALDPKTASPVGPAYLDAIKGATEFTAGKASSVSGLKAIGARELRVTIVKPFAYFLKEFTYPTAAPLDPAIMRNKVRTATGNFLSSNCPGNRAGAGPFTYVCYGSNFSPSGRTPSYTLGPNKYYYCAKPHIRINQPAISTGDIGYKAYLAGSIDTSGIPSAFLSQYKGKHNPQFHTAATSAVGYLTPNTKSAPFSDVHCRLALAYGLDRNTLVNKVLHGAPHTTYSVVPPGFLGFYSGADNPHYNLAKAKAELNQCSLKSTPVTLSYNTGSSDADNLAGAEVQMMNAVGFNAKTKPLSVDDWANAVGEDLSKTNTQLIRNGWQQDYPDPQDYVEQLLDCGQNYDIGGWCNSSFTALNAKADVETNTKVRAAMYRKPQHIALSQGAWISLDYGVGHFLIKNYVHGLTASVAYADLVPVNYDWSKVSVGK
ncbi:MAG: peptide ABC transporter substrate-binding protein [Chloroflexota bacterium]